MDRAALAAALSRRGIVAAPVLSVSEVIAHPQATTRELIFKARSPSGEAWPLLACPMRLSQTPPDVGRVPGGLDADATEILRDWGIAWRAPQAAE